MTVYQWRAIVRESTPVLAASVVVEIAAGQLLNAEAHLLYAVPLLLALVPAVNGLGGNVGTILSARLASGLHVGTVAPDARDPELWRNVATAILAALATYAFLAVFVTLVGPPLGIPVGVDLPHLLLVLVPAGAALVASLSALAAGAAFYSYRTGRDPDNVVIPVVTTFGDLLGIVWLLVTYGVVIA